MKRIVLSVVVSAMVFCGFAAIDAYKWKKDSNGSWSGCVTDPEHWPNGVVPENNARWWFDAPINASYDLTFPEGVYTNFAAFYPALYDGKSLTIDGQNTVWVHPENTEGTYHTTPFAIYSSVHVRDFVSLALSGAAPDPSTSPNLVFSNFLITATSPAARRAKVSFEKGHYEFLHPCGHSWNWSIQKPALYFFNLNSNDSTSTKDLFDLIEVEFKPGTVLNAPVIAVNGNAVSNVLTFAGTTNEIAVVDMPGRYDGQQIREDRTVTDIIFDRSELTATNRFNLGGDARVTNRVFRAFFRNKSKALLPSMYFQCGELELNIDDAEVEFGFNAGHSQNLNYDTVRSVKVNVTNGGKLINNQEYNGQGFYFGQNTKPERLHWMTVENSTLQLVPGSKMSIYGSLLTIKDSLFDIEGGSFFSSNALEENPAEIVFDHAVVTNKSNIALVSSGYGTVLFTNDTDVVFSSDLKIGGEALDPPSNPPRATVNMYGGRFLGTEKSGSLYIGYSANSEVTFNMYGGVISNAVDGQGVSIGEGGCTKFNMYGGVINTFNPRLGSNEKVTYDYTGQEPAELTLYDGLIVSRNAGNGETSGFAIGGQYGNSRRHVRLVLRGGVVESYTTFGGMNAACRGGNGRAMLLADGGTLRLPRESPCTILYMDEANLGPKGLTIDSNGFDATIKQHVWSNADGEEGALIFTGAGTKCPTGNVEQVSNIVLAGGVTDLSKLDGAAVNNLVVTNGATLKLDPSKTLTIRGTLTLGEASLAMTANGEVGAAYDILRFTTEPSDEVKRAIANLKYPGGVVGLGANRTCDLEVVPDGEGCFVTRMSVREGQTLTISLPEGVSNATEDVVFDSLDRLEADVGLGGALTLSGLYKYGAFKMVGAGSVEVADWSKLQTAGFSVKQGVLTVSGPAEGLEIDRQIVLANASTNDVFVINNAVDVKMPVPSGNNQNGEFLKRGAGRLVWEVEGSKNFLGGYGKSKINNNVWSWAVENIGQLTFDAVSGMVTTSGVPPLVVVEGELVLKGKGANPKMKITGPVAVGTSTKVGTVQPGLVVDGVAVDQNTYPHRRINIGCAINYTATSGAYRKGDFAISPYMILTNGASYVNDTFDLARFCMGKDMSVRLELDNATISSSYQFLVNRAQNEDPRTFVSVRNGSKILTGQFAPGYPSVVEFDRSELAKNDSGDGVKIVPETMPNGSTQLDARFRNRSVLRTVAIDPSTLSITGWRKPYRLLFDDSDWYPTNGVNDVTLEWAKPEQLYIVTTNRGLHFPVPATATWTVKHPVNGTGDLVNSGKGTLALGETAVAYSGATVAADAEGVVDFGGFEQNASLGGAGTFRNGTVAGGITVRDGQAPTLASDLELSGRVKVRVKGETALRPGDSFTVLKFQGTAPDVTQFKLENADAATGLGGTFAVEGDRVVCTPAVLPGIMLFLR